MDAVLEVGSHRYHGNLFVSARLPSQQLKQTQKKKKSVTKITQTAEYKAANHLSVIILTTFVLAKLTEESHSGSPESL